MNGLNGSHTTEEAVTFFYGLPRNERLFVSLVSGSQYIGQMVQIKDGTFITLCNSLNTETGKMEDRHVFHVNAVIRATKMEEGSPT